jgi:phosphate starvation-inducible PhoH-like protein
LTAAKIEVSQKKPHINPKTQNQKLYIEAMRTHDITFGLGPAGTGKTYLAVAMAVSNLKERRISRIILTRPAVEAGEALGFLPGDLKEKILPYLRPLYDALQDMLEPGDIERWTERGILEVAPLAYMRGRTLPNSFMILDEAQNTTREQMFMFLTRLGEGSKCVVTGDLTQIDLPPAKKSGIVEAVRILEHVPGIAFHRFVENDALRHPMVKDIVKAYQDYRHNH